MALEAELRRIAESAVGRAGDDEELAGIVPAEPRPGARVYVCAYVRADDENETSWLVLDSDGHPVEDRSLVRDAVAISALSELAEEALGIEPEEARVASPEYLDELGAKGGAELAGALKQTETVDELVRDVERGYKRPLR